MAITVSEAELESRIIRDGATPSRTKVFYVAGTDSEDEALTSVKAILVPYGLLWPNEVNLQQHGIHAGFRFYRAEVEYGPIPGGINVGSEPDKPTFTCDFSGETSRIQQGLEVVNTYPASGEPAVNFNGAINVTSDGVEGVEIPFPVFSFSLTISILTTEFTTSYQVAVARLSQHINSHSWRGFAPKEVRYDGMSCSGTFGDRTTLTHRFSVSPNMSDLVVGGITGITKAGWDYLWCFYRDATDDDAKMLIKRPLQANVNRVYPLGNFLALGLGN